MNIGIVGDIHFSEYSSILRLRGDKYSLRLENCLDSIKWAEEITANCDKVIYLGDFFDKSSLNASELTAFSELVWNDQSHHFLVGNHEIGIHDSLISSAHILHDVIDRPKRIVCDDVELCFLPYILESDRKESIADYFNEKTTNKRIIFSHNDIAGIQLGKIVSKSGFSIEDIENNCDLFINGHLHNGMRITRSIINLGNLTGQNFSEDGFKYKHHIMILDTDTLSYTLYDNPYAINFYKLDNISELSSVINGVVTLKCTKDDVLNVKQILATNTNVITSRIIIDYDKQENTPILTTLAVDHLEEFRNFALKELGTSELVLEEIEIIHG